ncbi:hypothetical protein F8M41_017394 [Gigaspora margarita]|uniref:Uncharacterized protein n=1 Tax=Gigaspora margarita TaxID=4874 RepID=A0A8H4EM74_GIGMA|nr:hypothetical protein F8M41_017394 [Gigaspora margarita]
MKTLKEDFKYPSTTIPPVTRSDPFESLEYYTSLIRSQLGRSNQAFASPTVTLAGPVPVILASTITPVNIQINNNRNNCSSVCTQTSLVVAISAGSGIPSSMQVTSDFPLVCYVPESLSSPEENPLPEEENTSVSKSFGQRKIISPFLAVPDRIPFAVYYGNESEDSGSSDGKWYETIWESKNKEY